MRESRAHFDAHKYTPSPEEAIEIANRRFTCLLYTSDAADE